MLTVTTRATEVIRDILGSQPDAGLRLAAVDDDHVGPIEIGAAVAPEPAPTDQVLDLKGARVFVDKAVADLLADRTLDVNASDGQGTAVFRLLRAN